MDLFRSRLSQIISADHELCLLAQKIDWAWIEKELSVHYSHTGRPSVPIRTMVGLLLLKYLFNQSDESVLERWVENPYWQHFCGETYFQHQAPFDPSDFVYFRKRVGEAGMEKILSLSVKLHPGAEAEDEVQIDTTVQEKNIAFPTDTRLQIKIIQYMWQIAEWESLSLRQSYRRVLKRLRWQQAQGHRPHRRKMARKARKRIKTICGRLLRDVERKLSPDSREWFQPSLDLCRRVLDQQRQDKQKIYSLHEPGVACIAKGKAYKKYEFGCKVALVRGARTGVITGMKSFAGNPYDGDTLDETLKQCQRVREDLGGKRPSLVLADRGFKGRQQVGQTRVMIPQRGQANQTPYQKRKQRQRFRKRAGIEPIIGHLKDDHRMRRNYLGHQGVALNALLAAAAFNLKKWINQLREERKRLIRFSDRLLSHLKDRLIPFLIRTKMIFLPVSQNRTCWAVK